MVSTVEGGQDPKSLSEIQPGMLLLGFVKSIKDYGVFVQFPSGLNGLAPKAVSSVLCTRALGERAQTHRSAELRSSRGLEYFKGAKENHVRCECHEVTGKRVNTTDVQNLLPALLVLEKGASVSFTQQYWVTVTLIGDCFQC